MTSSYSPLNPQQYDRRLKRQFRSVYEKSQTVGGKIGNPLGLPSWPNPVNKMVDFDQLACKEGWQGYLEYGAAVFAREAWAAFIPNPSELLRKSLLGGYKCGFYFLPKFKTPLTLFVGEDGVSMLAESVSPFTKALFWWWVGETIYAGFRAFQTVLHKNEACNTDTCETLLTNGKAPYSGNDDWSEALVMGEIADPCNKYGGFGSSITVHGNWSAGAVFRPDGTNLGPHTVQCAILEDGVPVKQSDYGDSNEKFPLYNVMHAARQHPSGESHIVSAVIKDTGNFNPLSGVNIDRFTVNSEG